MYNYSGAYADARLDTPPPPSRFRRPWSPDPNDPLPSISRGSLPFNQDQWTADAGDHHYWSGQQQRRQPSDPSIEALDLADYTQTLRARQAEAYPSFPSSQFSHQAYPPPLPGPSIIDPSTQSLYPPSLVSRGPTLSSSATHSTRPRTHSSRHHSLPPQAHHMPYVADPLRTPPHSEIDISRFPAWSRGWYAPSHDPHSNMYGLAEHEEGDTYPPLPTSLLSPPGKAKTISPFDPGYRSSSTGFYNNSAYRHSKDSDLFPWSADPPEYGNAPLDPEVKAERLRMLEQEFGDGKDKGKLADVDETPVVDEKGRLITQGPRKRIAMRVLQVLLNLGACIPSIYAALIIKADPRPPPAGTAAAFALYNLSALSLPLILWMFVFRPCCCMRKRRQTQSMGAPGMVVLPFNGGGKRNKGNKGWGKGKKGADGPNQGDVQVNLIVDPSAFNGGTNESETESEDDGYIPGAYAPGQSKKKRGRRKRKGVLAALAEEEAWRIARTETRKALMLDIALIFIWGAVFVLILIGKRCPSGGFEGWCNAYNVSSACACLLCIAFGISTFFGVKDLHGSKVSPRAKG